MIWMIYIVVVLAVSGLIGLHLGRFRDTYTEMTGMMAGMTMGMLNGFVLGYAAAALTRSMFWGNLFGILLGLVLGLYFGRAGGLMGVMDGAMGGVMGGSMGAMLAVMVAFPEWALGWTAALLGAIYVAGMIGLVVLIEQRAPDQVDQHRLVPLFDRFRGAGGSASAVSGLINYYEMFGLPVRAGMQEIAQAYLAYITDADDTARAWADEALGTLTDPQARQDYDRALAVAAGRGECCPPPARSTPVAAVAVPSGGTVVARKGGR